MIGSGVIYYFVIHLPQINRDKQKVELMKLEIQTDQISEKKREKQYYLTCDEQAEERAKDLLKTKAELDTTYKEMAEKDLFLKGDYDYAYKICLRAYGISD